MSAFQFSFLVGFSPKGLGLEKRAKREERQRESTRTRERRRAARMERAEIDSFAPRTLNPNQSHRGTSQLEKTRGQKRLWTRAESHRLRPSLRIARLHADQCRGSGCAGAAPGMGSARKCSISCLWGPGAAGPDDNLSRRQQKMRKDFGHRSSVISSRIRFVDFDFVNENFKLLLTLRQLQRRISANDVQSMEPFSESLPG